MLKAAIVATGVVGLGTLAYFWRSWEKKCKKRFEKLHKKLKLVGAIKDANGRYNPTALTKLMTCVNEEATKDSNKSLQHLVRERRKALKDRDFDDYLELAQEYFESEQAVQEEFMGHALDRLGIDQEEFAMERLKMQQQMPQQLMPNQEEGKEGEAVEVPPALTKLKTKKIFLEINSIQEGNNPQWQELLTKIEELKARMDNSVVEMLAIAIITNLVGDILYTEYNITEEQFGKALEKHNIMQDREIMELMQQKAAMYQMLMMGANQAE